MIKYIYIKLISISILLSILVSCDLDRFPSNGIAPEAITEKDLPALRNGMYYSMQNYPGVRSFITYDIVGGTLSGSSGNPLDIINSTLSPLNSTVSSGWNGYYRALLQVNNVLEICARFPNSTLSQSISAEAHYFRAYIYYFLVTSWGDVPIQTSTDVEDKPFRDPKADVWKLIESDLNTAIDGLTTGKSYYFLSKNAAKALKARAMLAQGKMGEAAQLAEELINSKTYRLDSFEKIFRKQTNFEVIFAFENNTEESGINLSDLFYTYAHPNKGQYSYRPSQPVVEYFDSAPTDNRKDISIINVQGSFCVNKYPSGQTGRDPVIISRIAEMYLISAEAQGMQAGLSRLNELRNYRGLASVNPTSEKDFITAILNERRIELLAENHMYHDLVRTGRATTDLGILPYQTLLPIPGKELLLNSNLVPNPGY